MLFLLQNFRMTWCLQTLTYPPTPANKTKFLPVSPTLPIFWLAIALFHERTEIRTNYDVWIIWFTNNVHVKLFGYFSMYCPQKKCIFSFWKDFLELFIFNQFVPNATFLYPLKTSEKRQRKSAKGTNGLKRWFSWTEPFTAAGKRSAIWKLLYVMETLKAYKKRTTYMKFRYYSFPTDFYLQSFRNFPKLNLITRHKNMKIIKIKFLCSS